MIRGAGPLALAALGGTFVEHRPGRMATSIPMSEDETDDLNFVNANDPRQRFILLDEIGSERALYAGDKEHEGFVKRLIAVALTPDQVTAAAVEVAKNPELLIKLYKEAISSDELTDSEQCAAREKIFDLVLNVATTMLAIRSRKAIIRSLIMRRDQKTQKTLLACLAQFARCEVGNTKKCSHLTATTILKALGYDDVFARSLD